MTKERYLALKATPISEWTLSECREADALVKCVTLETVKSKLSREEPALRDFAMLMIRCHYGCCEVDDFLKQLNAYPDWV